VELADIQALAASLTGVTSRESDGLVAWRYQGRLVARQLDRTHVVIRTRFEARDALVARFPDTFSVPRRFARHMMVVADLESGDQDEGAVLDAVVAAWELQSQPP
jgi:hypothetical protein